jgi:hypothetical protein
VLLGREGAGLARRAIDQGTPSTSRETAEVSITVETLSLETQRQEGKGRETAPMLPEREKL